MNIEAHCFGMLCDSPYARKRAGADVTDVASFDFAGLLLHFNVRELYHLAPFLSFNGHDLAEISRRAAKSRAIETGQRAAANAGRRGEPPVIR
ncbi:MAG: hypothetical protein ACREDY_29085 [Bradyrhizobium sp.]